MRPRSPRQKKFLLVAGALLAIWLLSFVARKIDWGVFADALRGANPWIMTVAVIMGTLSFPLRLPRWRWLLPEPDGRPLATSSLWHAIAIGFTANNLPLRIGEVVRAATVARLERFPFATAFASLAVERAVDGVVVVALFGIGLMTTDLATGTDMVIRGKAVGPLVMKAGVIALIASLLTVLAAWRPSATLALVRWLAPRGPRGEKFLHFVEQVLNGLTALRDPRRALPVLGWSVVLWVVNAAAFWVGCLAFGIHIPFTASFILQGMVVVGLVLVPSPGGIGGFEAAIVGTLALFDIDGSRATAYAIAFHLTTAIPIVLLGFWSLRHIGGSLRGVAAAAEAAPAAVP